MDDERDEFDNRAVGSRQQTPARQRRQGATGNSSAARPATRTTAWRHVRSSTIRRRSPVGARSGPQPVIEGMPAEVALNPEAAGEGNAPPRTRPHVNGERQRQRRAAAARPRRGERSRPRSRRTPMSPTPPKACAATAGARRDAGEHRDAGAGRRGQGRRRRRRWSTPTADTISHCGIDDSGGDANPPPFFVLDRRQGVLSEFRRNTHIGCNEDPARRGGPSP